MLAGCYESKVVTFDGSVPDREVPPDRTAPPIPGCGDIPDVDETGFTPSIAVAEAPEVRLQGSDFEIAWFDDCRQHLYWVENRGGLVIAGAVVDGGRLVFGPFDVVADVPPEVRPDSIAARRLGDRVAVYWITDEGRRLYRRFVSSTGVASSDLELLADGIGNRLPLSVFDDPEAGHQVLVQLAEIPHVIHAREMGAGEPMEVGNEPRSWVYAAAAGRDGSLQFAWADRSPGGEDRLFRWEARPSERMVGPLRPVITSENIILSFFAEPTVYFDDNEVFYVGVSFFTEGSAVLAIDESDAPVVFALPEAGRPVVGRSGDSVLALVGEREGATLSFYELDPILGQVRDAQQLLDSGARASAYALTADRAIGVGWVVQNTELRYRYRPRRPR